MSKFGVLLVDDHEVVLSGLTDLFQRQPDIAVVGRTTSGREALALMIERQPDAVITDISLPDLDGVHLARQIKAEYPRTAIIVYTMHSDEEYIMAFFKIGLSGYVFKSSPLLHVVMAVQAAKNGGIYLDKAAHQVIWQRVSPWMGQEAGPANTACLSRRELEVLRALTQGLSTKTIAMSLGISTKTVESHKYNIMEKLQVHNMVDLLKAAFKHKLVTLG